MSLSLKPLHLLPCYKKAKQKSPTGLKKERKFCPFKSCLSHFATSKIRTESVQLAELLPKGHEQPLEGFNLLAYTLKLRGFCWYKAGKPGALFCFFNGGGASKPCHRGGAILSSPACRPPPVERLSSIQSPTPCSGQLLQCGLALGTGRTGRIRTFVCLCACTLSKAQLRAATPLTS